MSQPAEKPSPTLLRYLYLSDLRLLRPAGSAARRLTIGLAAYLLPVPVKPLPVRPARIAGGIVLRPDVLPGILIPLWTRPGAGGEKICLHPAELAIV